MDAIGTYIYSIAAAAILCAVLGVLAGKSGILSPLMKLMCGVVMTAVVAGPISNFQGISLNRYLDQLNMDAQAFADHGTENSREALQNRIIASSEAYILDKAAAYRLNLVVSVALDEQSMTPIAVEIQGDAAPAAKTALQNVIAQDLGIPPEAQIWK